MKVRMYTQRATGRGDAINEAARRYYEQYGFLSLSDDPRHLFLPLNIIRKLQLPPL